MSQPNNPEQGRGNEEKEDLNKDLKNENGDGKEASPERELLKQKKKEDKEDKEDNFSPGEDKDYNPDDFATG
jgi:hypothetical protein